MTLADIPLQEHEKTQNMYSQIQELGKQKKALP
jgi:hypothetical protein